MLFSHWERRYPYLSEARPLAEEGLLVPFYVGGKALGTIWAIATASPQVRCRGPEVAEQHELFRVGGLSNREVDRRAEIGDRRAREVESRNFSS